MVSNKYLTRSFDFFGNLPIRSLFIVSFSFIAVVALTFSMVVGTITSYHIMTSEQVEDFTSMGSIIAGGISLSASKDPRRLEQQLALVGLSNRVIKAGIYDARGSLLAKYDPNHEASYPVTSNRITTEKRSGQFDIWVPIKNEGEVSGYVYLDGRVYLDKSHFTVLFAASVIIFGILFYLFSIIGRVISGPVAEYCHAIEAIANGAYDTELPKIRRSAEFRRMATAIRKLVHRVQTRDYQNGLAQNTLNNLIADRTIELLKTSQDLRLAKELADSADHTKSVFLTHMSSSLRTPINGILLYADLLEDAFGIKGDETQSLKDITKIRTSAKQLLTSIDKILELSQFEVGYTQLKLDSINLKDTIDEVRAISKSLATKNSNQTEIIYLGEPPKSLRTDEDKLKRILTSLLDNAHKYTKNGLVTLQISTESQDYVNFIVSDTGIGMDKEQTRNLFDIFKSKRKNTSLGLSLTLVKKYINLLGGTIDFRSELNSGTMVTVKLPTNTNFAPSLSNTTALLIAKDDELREEAAGELIRKGFWTAVAPTMEEGLSLVQSLHPQIIILEIDPAAESEWSQLAEMEKDESWRQCKVFICMVDDSKMGFVAETQEIIRKPITEERLMRVMNRHIPTKDSWVMIVEDDRLAALALSRMVEHLGWTTRVFYSAEEALEALSRGKNPSLILLDLLLPGLDGVTFRTKVDRSIPTVIITGKEVTGEDILRLNQGDHPQQDKVSLIETICVTAQNFVDARGRRL